MLSLVLLYKSNVIPYAFRLFHVGKDVVSVCLIRKLLKPVERHLAC